jgi:hypothetical protein
MQDVDIITKVILTEPQSFIEANLPRLCYLITGINPIDNKSVSVSLFDNGGFQFTNLSDENSFSYSNAGIKDKNDFLKLLDEFFSKKNQSISEAFASQGIKAQFFPRNFMKPIAVSPNYSVKGAANAITSWTAVYKVEIPAYENPATRRTEYANLVNGGIEITLSSGGKITSFKYNLLPMHSQKSAALYKVVADESAVPQLVYLLNKNTNTVAPFYLSVTEAVYIPASRESVVLNEEPGEPFKNQMGFKSNRVVVWLMTPDVKKRKLKTFDFFASRKKEAANNLPAGAKLIRLEPKSELDENTPCVYWWQGSYHQSDFPERSLGKSNNIITELSGQVLQNDIEHLLSRILSYEKKEEEYDKVIKLIRDFSKKALSKKQIEDGLVALNTSLQLNKNDKPATILSWQKALSNVYNPKINDTTKFFDETLILPLSSDWFKEDAELLKSYNAFWVNWLPGFSGEGITPEDNLIKFKTELVNLKTKTEANDSPEAKWLQTLSSEFLSKIRRIIFLHDDTWYYKDDMRYAQGIAIENSSGPFKLPPPLNVLIHELTVNSNNIFLSITPDTHIEVTSTEAAWDKVSKNGLGALKGDQDSINHLYQSHRALASIALAIIISKIS